MNSDNGHIYDLTKKEILNVKGKLIPWKVGERVEVKECLFEVVEIECIPVDKIVLKGLAKPHTLGKGYRKWKKKWKKNLMIIAQCQKV